MEVGRRSIGRRSGAGRAPVERRSEVGRAPVGGRSEVGRRSVGRRSEDIARPTSLVWAMTVFSRANPKYAPTSQHKLMFVLCMSQYRNV